MLSLKIEITGETWEDLELAIDEVKAKVMNGHYGGADGDISSRYSYHFGVGGEPVDTDKE